MSSDSNPFQSNKLVFRCRISSGRHIYRTADSSDVGGQPGSNMLSWIFEKFVLAMVAYFVVSIVHSLAQSYHKRKLKQAQAAAEHHSR